MIGTCYIHLVWGEHIGVVGGTYVLEGTYSFGRMGADSFGKYEILFESHIAAVRE